MPIDHARMYRFFEQLDELVSVVENARGVLVSGNCVVPREHMLDLLDDLRDALPVELEQAYQVLEERAGLLDGAQQKAHGAVNEARSIAARTLAEASDEAAAELAQAHGHAESLVAAARTDAAALAAQGRSEYDRAVAAGSSEHDRLVTTTEVHRAAAERAAELTADAATQTEAMLAEATARSERIRTDADDYVDSRLAEFSATLTRTLRSVEQGRTTLRSRQPGDPAPAVYDQNAR